MKVGDYVRTDSGIHQITKYKYEPEYENGHVLWFEKSDSGWRYTDKDLPKSSPNIIDLIEEGDYVNWHRVAEIEILPTKQKIVVVGYGYDYDEISENNIKSIVTKEQFEEMEYKL